MQSVLLGCLPEISSTGDLYLSEDLEVIVQSLFVIFNTKLESRIWQPKFGCRLKEYIWDILDDRTLESIKSDLENAIKKWEPRITVTNLTVTKVEDTVGSNNPTVKIEVAFTFDRHDYSHTFQIGANTSMMDLNIYQLKTNKRHKYWQVG